MKIVSSGILVTPPQHKDIHSDGGGNQSHFHNPDHNDTKPDGVKAKGVHGWENNGNCKNDAGKDFKKHPQENIQKDDKT